METKPYKEFQQMLKPFIISRFYHGLVRQSLNKRKRIKGNGAQDKKEPEYRKKTNK